MRKAVKEKCFCECGCDKLTWSLSGLCTECVYEWCKPVEVAV